MFDKNFHFYILIGKTNKKEILDNFKDFQKEIELKNIKENKLKIETVRKIKEENLISVPQNKIRIFWIETEFLSKESQNALLKTFEEPEKNTYFILNIPEIENILPTIKSRARIIEFKNENQERFEDFFDLDFKEREEKIKKIEREDLVYFFRELENKIQKKEIFDEILKLKKMALKQGSDFRKILSYINIYFLN